MVGELVATWTWNQRGQALDERQRLERDGLGAIPPAPAQSVDHATIGSEREALAGDGGASHIPAQVLEALALVGVDQDLGVQREAVEVAAQLAGDPE